MMASELNFGSFGVRFPNGEFEEKYKDNLLSERQGFPNRYVCYLHKVANSEDGIREIAEFIIEAKSAGYSEFATSIMFPTDHWSESFSVTVFLTIKGTIWEDEQRG